MAPINSFLKLNSFIEYGGECGVYINKLYVDRNDHETCAYKYIGVYKCKSVIEMIFIISVLLL